MKLLSWIPTMTMDCFSLWKKSFGFQRSYVAKHQIQDLVSDVARDCVDFWGDAVWKDTLIIITANSN